MRETFSRLLQQSQDYCVDDTVVTVTGLSSSSTFLKREINHTVKDIYTLMKEHSLQPLPQTATTVDGQIWYHNPPGLSKIESITMTSGNLVIPLRVVQSQKEWDRLHIFTMSSTMPQVVFPRRDDYGIWPTPSSSSATLTIVGNYQPNNMTALDVSDGTVTATNNSRTITGSGTSFTSSMVGRFFMLTDSEGVPFGSWYRISGYTSSSEVTLETYFEEATQSGASYIIGESPSIPEELHEFIPYRAAGIYYGTRRRDVDQAQRMLNYYYTGDFSNPNRSGNIRSGILGVFRDLRERGRDNSQIVNMTSGQQAFNRFQVDIWGSTITSA